MGLRRESNPGHLHPKQVFYRLTTKPCIDFIRLSLCFSFLKKNTRAQSDSNQWPRELQSYALPLSYAPSYFSFMFSPFCVFLSCLPLKKTPPVGLEPTTLRLKAARSTDWARKAPIILFAFVLFIYNSLLLFSLFTVSFFLLLLLCYLLLFFCCSFLSTFFSLILWNDNVAEWSKACD